jgi:PAS domain S-box-containing protein
MDGESINSPAERAAAMTPLNGRAVLDRDLRFVEVDPTFALMTGMAPAEHLGLTLADALPDLGASLERLLRPVALSGTALDQVELTAVIPSALGPGGQWLASAYPVRASSGAVLGVELSLEESPASRHAAVARPELGQHYRQAVFAQAPIGALVADSTGQLLDVNQAFCRLTGYAREELLRLRLSDLAEPDQPGAEQELLDRIHEAQQPTAAAFARYRRKDGQVIQVRVTRSPVPDSGPGRQIELIFVEDLTDWTRAMVALQRSEAMFAAAFNDGPVILSITRLADGRILRVNERFVEATGYTRQEAIGRTPLELNIWVDPQQRAEGLQHLRQGHALRQGEADFRMKNGSIHTCLLFATMLEVDGEPAVLTALTDITDRRRAEAERARLAEENARLYADEQRARAEAERAVRLRDEFLSIASHELKTPLTTMLGNAELMQRRAAQQGSLNERDSRAVARFIEQIQRMNHMVSELLDVTQIAARGITIERHSIDLCELARRVVDDLRPTLPAHPLELQLPGAPVLIDGDELRLARVVTNLVQNAGKYSPAGSVVSVRVEAHPDRATIAVADRGIGIAQADLPRLFERYFRAHSTGVAKVGGMGIGLYVVRELVELHGGSITVESEEGRGSTFTVTLPR